SGPLYGAGEEHPAGARVLALHVDERDSARIGAPQDRIADEPTVGASAQDLVLPHRIAKVAPVQIGGVAHADHGPVEGSSSIEGVELLAALGGEEFELQSLGSTMDRTAGV